MKDFVIEVANKVLNKEQIGFGSPELISLALQRSELINTERPNFSPDSLVLLMKSYEKSHTSTTLEWQKALENEPVVLSKFCEIFQHQVDTEISYLKCNWAKAVLMGLARQTNPQDKGRLKRTEEFEIPDAEAIFQDLMKGKRDITNFGAFLALHPFGSFENATNFAKDHPTLEVFAKPLPGHLQRKQPRTLTSELGIGKRPRLDQLPDKDEHSCRTKEKEKEDDDISVMSIGFKLK